jgi:hypothetical protein
MWKLLKKHLKKNIETYYFKEIATRDNDGYVTNFKPFKNTKAQIDKDLMLFHIEKNKKLSTFKIISEIDKNDSFNLKMFNIKDLDGTIKRVIIFNDTKMTLRSENLEDGVKHIYGKPGSLYEEHSELLQRIS